MIPLVPESVGGIQPGPWEESPLGFQTQSVPVVGSPPKVLFLLKQGTKQSFDPRGTADSPAIRDLKVTGW